MFMLTYLQPQSLFEQTMYEIDQIFYATFPAARNAAFLGRDPYYLYSPADYSLRDGVQSFEYDGRTEQVPDISSTSLSYCDVNGTTRQPPSLPSHFDYFRTYHQQQPSYYPLPASFLFYLHIFQLFWTDWLTRSKRTWTPQCTFHPNHSMPTINHIHPNQCLRTFLSILPIHFMLKNQLHSSLTTRP